MVWGPLPASWVTSPSLSKGEGQNEVKNYFDLFLLSPFGGAGGGHLSRLHVPGSPVVGEAEASVDDHEEDGGFAYGLLFNEEKELRPRPTIKLKSRVRLPEGLRWSDLSF